MGVDRVSFLQPGLLKDARLSAEHISEKTRPCWIGGPGRAPNLRRGHNRHMLSGLAFLSFFARP